MATVAGVLPLHAASYPEEDDNSLFYMLNFTARRHHGAWVDDLVDVALDGLAFRTSISGSLYPIGIYGYDIWENVANRQATRHYLYYLQVIVSLLEDE